MTTLQLLPYGQRDDAADRYLATLAPRSAINARSQLEQVARWLLGLPDAPRLGRAAFGGARRLHIALDRVPWSSVTFTDAQRVAHAALSSHRSRRTAAGMFTAFKGVLRASAVDRGELWAIERALRVDDQHANGRTVAQVVAEWSAEERQRLGFENDTHPPLGMDCSEPVSSAIGRVA